MAAGKPASGVRRQGFYAQTLEIFETALIQYLSYPQPTSGLLSLSRSR
jgi:hypothetical protein